MTIWPYIHACGVQGMQLKRHLDATLGSGNLRDAVRLPTGEDLNEWLAVNSKYILDPQFHQFLICNNLLCVIKTSNLYCPEIIIPAVTACSCGLLQQCEHAVRHPRGVLHAGYLPHHVSRTKVNKLSAFFLLPT